MKFYTNKGRVLTLSCRAREHVQYGYAAILTANQYRLLSAFTASSLCPKKEHVPSLRLLTENYGSGTSYSAVWRDPGVFDYE